MNNFSAHFETHVSRCLSARPFWLRFCAWRLPRRVFARSNRRLPAQASGSTAASAARSSTSQSSSGHRKASQRLPSKSKPSAFWPPFATNTEKLSRISPKTIFSWMKTAARKPSIISPTKTDMPLRLGLLIDTSLSQRRVLDQERTASYSFLDHLLREDKDAAFVIHFDREVELLEDFTPSRPKLQAALQKLSTPQFDGGGSTSGGGNGKRRRRQPRSRLTRRWNAALRRDLPRVRRTDGQTARPQSAHHSFRRRGPRQQRNHGRSHRHRTALRHHHLFDFICRRRGKRPSRRIQ